MTIARKITGVTTAAAIAITALVPMATAASAEGWRGGNRGERHYAYNDRRNFKKRHHARKHDRRHQRRHYVVRRKRDNTGKYIAIGVGALLLGAILADSAHR